MVSFAKGKEPKLSSSKDSASIRLIRLAGDQEKRDVGSASQNTFSTGAALGIKNGHKKGGSCITRLIRIPQSKKPEKSQILRF